MRGEEERIGMEQAMATSIEAQVEETMGNHGRSGRAMAAA